MALKQSSFDRVLLFALVLVAQPAFAQISAWKLGSAGLSWSESDTTRLFIDFASAPGSIQPIYLTPEKTVFFPPRQLGFLARSQRYCPRLCRWRDSAHLEVERRPSCPQWQPAYRRRRRHLLPASRRAA